MGNPSEFGILGATTKGTWGWPTIWENYRSLRGDLGSMRRTLIGESNFLKLPIMVLRTHEWSERKRTQTEGEKRGGG